MNPWVRNATAVAVLFALGGAANAGSVAVPHTFEAGTPARAAEVNANFAALVAALNAALDRIDELERDLDALLPEQLVSFSEHLEVFPDPVTPTGSTIRISRANLQIVNGQGATNTINGLGNLIVGYNEPRGGQERLPIGFGVDQIITVEEVCSKGEWETSEACITNGGFWGVDHKSGSHNIVGGMRNAYSSYGGFVVGRNNTINREWSVVSGGVVNVASGTWSSVSGGRVNTASGDNSSVSGGRENTASGIMSSVSGGQQNTASGTSSSVSGGFRNTASWISSSVSGGRDNTASGMNSSVSGGRENVASGSLDNTSSSVSGGFQNTASGNNSSVSGGRNNTASGNNSSILGGASLNVSIDDGRSPN